LRDAGFERVEITRDLSGRDRVVTARRERAHG
jgi:methylase of polypeptide subunit release factors